MTDLIAFIRDNIDDNPNLLSTIANNDTGDEYRELLEAYSEYMRKYGNDYQKNIVRKDTDDFRRLANAVQAFNQIAIDSEIEDLILPPSPTIPITKQGPDMQPQTEFGLAKPPKHILPPSKEMSGKSYLEKYNAGFQTPAKKGKLSSLYDDSSNSDSEPLANEDAMGVEYLNALKKKEAYNSPENSDDDDPKEYKPVSKNSSKRANKTMKTVKEKMKNDYTFDNRTVNTSEFRDSLWNILINGNYRVKFSPKCATRTGAKEYCKRKFDGNGYPLYRLIPPNTTDDFDNQICDLNGDSVDDVVIVDKSGRPVIINGYKLVKASPYKKIWLEERAQNKGNILPFNYWLQKKFDLAHTWDYTKEVWDKGERDWDISKVKDENAKKAYQTYIDAGVGKPKLNKRITARGLWSSIFNRIWTLALELIFDKDSELKALKPIFNYMKVSNAMFIKFYELTAMEKHDCANKWMKWISYKNLHPKEVNAEIGLAIQQDYNGEIKAILPLNGAIVGGKDNIDPNSKLGGMITETIRTILAEGLNATDENMDNIKQFASAVASGQVSKTVINQNKEEFKTNIDEYVDTLVGGNYIKYKQIREEDRQKNVEKVDSYITRKY